MKPTRRLFLQNAALSAIAATLPTAAFAQKLLTDQNKTFAPEALALLDGISSRTFEPWIGSTFQVSLNNKPMGSLVLLSVEETDTEAKDASASPEMGLRIGPVRQPVNVPTMTSFSLHFQGAGTALKQNTYTVSHDWLGTFPLFLVPSGLSGMQPTCTAVFSLLEQTGLKNSA